MMETKNRIREFIKHNLLTLIGVGAGLVGGWLYWRLVGCESGTCPITASPVNSALWGAVFGGLLFSMFKNKGRSHGAQSDENDH